MRMTSGDPVTNIMPPRNVMFTGRSDVLSQLHRILEPSLNNAIDKRSRSSCVIHGIGGMGKTQTALEYTYRYRELYSHIFWLHAELNATLLDSFLESTGKLPLELKGHDESKKIKLGLEWFQSTSKLNSLLTCMMLNFSS
jgi:hypothetical protein